ncbi:hypothetical protein AFLA_011761 [Aspergillus flavus NRRL3357]|nr:hypothetical protein AFLA_011761 [Aspergillus flavus NRRL3357]
MPCAPQCDITDQKDEAFSVGSLRQKHDPESVHRVQGQIRSTLCYSRVTRISAHPSSAAPLFPASSHLVC